MIRGNHFQPTTSRIASTTPSVGSKSKNDVPASGFQPSDFQPVWVLEVEIGRALPGLSTVDLKTGQKYRRGMFLVRLHNQIIGIVELRLDQDTLSPAEFAHHIWSALKPSII